MYWLLVGVHVCPVTGSLVFHHLNIQNIHIRHVRSIGKISRGMSVLLSERVLHVYAVGHTVTERV